MYPGTVDHLRSKMEIAESNIPPVSRTHPAGVYRYTLVVQDIRRVLTRLLMLKKRERQNRS